MINPLAPCFEWFLNFIEAVSYNSPNMSFLALVFGFLTISSLVRWLS